MTSSALAGDRRWGSARKGGMTVLGKVAVPKPLNLPSQRLENHGLDPNVEIVPKGTLSWGTHSASSATNVWGSASADSKANSPSHLSGRPSSGGSGTRPSTAGSDRVNETAGCAWGPNSRPSSASGLLSSDQLSSTSLCSHSAEPRPASSQLSRFAEHVSDSQGAWGESGTSERFGMVPSKKENFSLTSGDFPTLGSEKDQSSNITESKVSTEEMDAAFDRSKRDDSESVGEGLQPSMENWPAEHQQYFNPNIPPQHFDAWRGPPMNAPPGIWYRGPQGGPPFGPPIGPVGFPIDPFPYYHPQIPPPAFANSQPVPPPRGGPRGHHPKSGYPYRPKINDAFMHPGMAYRPDFYPPPMAFEGYFGPPRRYCNPNEPDIPFRSMGVNHPVYGDRYSSPNAPGPSDSHARAGVPGPSPGPSGKKSDVDFFHSGDSRMSSKFLVKHHGEWEGKEQAENRECMPPVLALDPLKEEKTVMKAQKYEWGTEDDGDNDIYSSAHCGGGGNCVPETIWAKASQSLENPTDDFRIKKLESGSTCPLVSAPTAKDVTLLRKTECLNAKIRSFDGRADYSSSEEEQKCGSDAAIVKVATFPRKSGNAAPMERSSISDASFSNEIVSPRDNRMVHQTAEPMSRRPYHGISNRSDHGGRGKFGNQPTDGWQRRPLASEIPNTVSAPKIEFAHNYLECGFQQGLEVAEILQRSKDEGGFNTKLQDSIGSPAQMREIAKQRAMKLQREEEERIRDQKAKAQAKLDDLNRRTQSGDASNPVAKKSISSESSKEQQGGKGVEYTESNINVDSPSLVIQLGTDRVLVNDENKKLVVGSSITSKAVPVETSKANESAETLLLKQDVNANFRDGKPSPELDKGFVRLNKSTSYKQNPNNSAVKSYNENLVSVYSREGRRSPTDASVKYCEPHVASSEVSSSNQPYLINNCNNISQSSVAQQANSRNSKSKNKQDDIPLVSTAVARGPQNIPSENTQKTMIPQARSLQLSFGTVQVAVDGESGFEMSGQPSSLPSEATHEKANSQLKPRHNRRVPRSQQVDNKLHSNAAAVWAPVRSQNKVDISEGTTTKGDLKQGPESHTSAESDHLVQNTSRSKMAEMDRYVPKHVSKELGEQVNMQPTLSSVGASTLNDTRSAQPVGSATVDAAVESGQRLVKNNKQGKTHGTWRQRGSTEPHAKNMRQRPSFSDASMSSLEDVSRNGLNPESNQLQAVTETPSEMDDSGAKIATQGSVVSAPETHHVPKDAVITGKSKHYSYGGHKKLGNGKNNDNRNISSTESDRTHVQSPYSDINQSKRPRENPASSERASSHWQPKASGHSVGKKGGRITGSQGGLGEASRVNINYYPLQQQAKTSPQHNESDGIDRSHSELVSESKAEGDHGPRRGRKFSSSMSLDQISLDQSSADEYELGIADSTNVQHAQQNSAGSRRIGHQVNRYGRDHESRGDLPAQSNRQHDRPRHMHYEYQEVGSLDHKKNNFEGQGDGIRNAGSRNKFRGQSHSRRGGGSFQVP